MIQSITQQINQYSYPVFKKLEPKDYNPIGGKSAQKIDSEEDFRRKVVEQNERQIFVLGLFALISLLGTLFANFALIKKNKGHSTKDIPATIREFESLKENTKIPTIDTCKSINKDLKTILKRQINYAKAGDKMISDAGEPKLSNRLLLYGPAGVGKSYFAKIFAKSLDAEYKEVLYSDFNSIWVGEDIDNLKTIFEEILKKAKNNSKNKYVVAFNEIDTLVQPAEKISRTTKGTHYLAKLEERSVFLNYLELLNEKTPNVTIIGTTNISPQNSNLDRAAMSRFQNLVEVPYPEKNCLYEAIKMNLSKIANSAQFIRDNDDNLKKLAERMAERKFSFRNLEYVINDAKAYHLDEMTEGKKPGFAFKYLEKAEKNLKYSDGELEV